MLNRYIVIATRDEIGLVERIPQFKGYPVIITGVGALNVIEALKDIPRDAYLVNIGYAGSIDLPIGTLFTIGSVELLHEVDYNDRCYFLNGSTPCYTSNDFVKKTDIKGAVFDMELAYIAAMGFPNLEAYKVVSDHCDYEEYKQNIKPME